MMDHEALIDRLSQSAGPVRRPLPPASRAVAWAAIALPMGLIATGLLPRSATDWSHPGAIWAGIGIALSFLLGLGLIATAFTIGIAGRFSRWQLWFGAGAGLWLAANIAAIMTSPHPLGRIGSGSYCFSFVVLASAPMVFLAIVWLRRTRAIHPARSLALAGMGSAFMAMALLGFCHPGAGHIFDFLMHLAAAIVTTGLAIIAGRRWVAI